MLLDLKCALFNKSNALASWKTINLFNKIPAAFTTHRLKRKQKLPHSFPSKCCSFTAAPLARPHPQTLNLVPVQQQSTLGKAIWNRPQPPARLTTTTPTPPINFEFASTNVVAPASLSQHPLNCHLAAYLFLFKYIKNHGNSDRPLVLPESLQRQA